MTEMSTSPSQATALIDPANTLQPLALRSMFWRPTYLEGSAWLEHIPFAFWLIEAQRPKVFVELGTQHGTSYFSFCQAVDRLQLDTRCFAVDTWKGDAQTGQYDEKVFNSVKAHNDAQYAGFSRLLRSSFDDALDRFTDGSIDLLHMDGLPTADAVGHDLDRWLPKMSERGVIIVHNTNTRERDVDVFKLFESLQSQYPAFEFLHGNGLGVLAVGQKQERQLRHLLESNRNETAKRTIQEAFSRLGRACAAAYVAAQQQERAGKLGGEVGKQRKLLEEAELSLKKAKDDLASRSRELSEARTRLQVQADHHTLERGQLSERASLLQELRSELKAEVVRLQEVVDTMASELQRRAAEVGRLELAHAASQQQCDASAKAVEERDAMIAALKTDVEGIQQRDVKIAELTRQDSDRQAELESLREQLVQGGQELAAVRNEQTAQAQRNQQLEAEREQREERIATLSRAGEEQRAKLLALEARLAQQDLALQAQLEQAKLQAQAMAEQQERIASQAAELDRRERAIAALEAEKVALNANVQERFRELAKLTQMLEAARKAGAEHDKQAAANEQPDSKQEAIREAVVEQLYAELARKDEQVQALVQKLAANAASQVNRRVPSSSLRLFGSADPHARLGKKERKLRKQAQLIRESGLFDDEWYLARYPDVKQSNMDPAEHFLHYGAAELRDPSAFFDTEAYIAANSDVVESQINPLVHYINHGSKEGRVIQSAKES